MRRFDAGEWLLLAVVAVVILSAVGILVRMTILGLMR
jgi:hypothetical protein